MDQLSSFRRSSAHPGITIDRGGHLAHIVKGHRAGPFIYDFYDIELCLSGGCDMEVGGITYAITPGDLYIVPPHTVYTKTFTADVSSAAYVCIQWDSMEDYFSAMGMTKQNVVFPHKLTQQAAAYLEDIISSLDVRECSNIPSLSVNQIVQITPNPDYSDHFQLEAQLRSSARFALFLSELLHIHGGDGDQRTEQQKYVSTALRFMEANYRTNIQVSAIAAHVGIDRSYLFRLFREETGMSIQDYLIRMRMNAACDFLRQSEATVKNAAASVGYEAFSFSRIFKKTVGMAPAEYHRLHTQK